MPLVLVLIAHYEDALDACRTVHPHTVFICPVVEGRTIQNTQTLALAIRSDGSLRNEAGLRLKATDDAGSLIQ